MHHRSSTVDYRTLPPQLGSALRGEVYELRKRVDGRAFPPTVGLRRLSASGVPLPSGAAIVPLTAPPMPTGMPLPPRGSDRPLGLPTATSGGQDWHPAADTSDRDASDRDASGRSGSGSDGGRGGGGWRGGERGGGSTGGTRGSGASGSSGRRRSGGSTDAGANDTAGGAFRIGVGRPGLDHALRVDLLVATLSGMRSRGHLDSPTPIGIMIKRPGALEPTEDDLGWLRAWPIACDIGGCTRGPVWTITRHGWIDLGENSVVELPRHWLRRPPPGHPGTT
ncbi:hypothetical protein [Flindersiella endophytica]